MGEQRARLQPVWEFLSHTPQRLQQLRELSRGYALLPAVQLQMSRPFPAADHGCRRRNTSAGSWKHSDLPDPVGLTSRHG